MMMFHSNQVFRVSGELDTLEAVITFAMKLSGADERFARKDRPLSPIWQETPSGLYVLGSSLVAGANGRKLDEGWNEYPFDYDPAILAGIVAQWIRKQPEPVDPNQCWDGSHYRGFLCRAIKDLDYEERKAIRNPVHGIVCFQPFNTFYAK